MRIIAIDPGLSSVGVAIFETGVRTFTGHRKPTTPEEKACCLYQIERIVTKPETPLPERLALIETFVGDMMHMARPEPLVLLEVPAIAGVYAQRRRRQRGKAGINAAEMALFNQALGVIRLALHRAVVEGGGTVRDVQVSSRTDKKQRRMIVERLLRDVPKRPTEHQIDAIFLGITTEWSATPPETEVPPCKQSRVG